MTELSDLMKQLQKLKTDLAVVVNKRDENFAILEKNYNIKTVKQAEKREKELEVEEKDLKEKRNLLIDKAEKKINEYEENE